MLVSNPAMLSTERGIGLRCKCSTITTAAPEHGYATVTVSQVPGCMICGNAPSCMRGKHSGLPVTACPCSAAVTSSQILLTSCDVP